MNQTDVASDLLVDAGLAASSETASPVAAIASDTPPMNDASDSKVEDGANTESKIGDTQIEEPKNEEPKADVTEAKSEEEKTASSQIS